jgi:hypothetical protein
MTDRVTSARRDARQAAQYDLERDYEAKRTQGLDGRRIKRSLSDSSLAGLKKVASEDAIVEIEDGPASATTLARLRATCHPNHAMNAALTDGEVSILSELIPRASDSAGTEPPSEAPPTAAVPIESIASATENACGSETGPTTPAEVDGDLENAKKANNHGTNPPPDNGGLNIPSETAPQVHASVVAAAAATAPKALTETNASHEDVDRRDVGEQTKANHVDEKTMIVVLEEDDLFFDMPPPFTTNQASQAASDRLAIATTTIADAAILAEANAEIGQTNHIVTPMVAPEQPSSLHMEVIIDAEVHGDIATPQNTVPPRVAPAKHNQKKPTVPGLSQEEQARRLVDAMAESAKKVSKAVFIAAVRVLSARYQGVVADTGIMKMAAGKISPAFDQAEKAWSKPELTAKPDNVWQNTSKLEQLKAAKPATTATPTLSASPAPKLAVKAAAASAAKPFEPKPSATPAPIPTVLPPVAPASKATPASITVSAPAEAATPTPTASQADEEAWTLVTAKTKQVTPPRYAPKRIGEPFTDASVKRRTRVSGKREVLITLLDGTKKPSTFAVQTSSLILKGTKGGGIVKVFDTFDPTKTYTVASAGVIAATRTSPQTYSYVLQGKDWQRSFVLDCKLIPMIGHANGSAFQPPAPAAAPAPPKDGAKRS